MKKKLMIGLGTALLLALAGCGSSGNSSEKQITQKQSASYNLYNTIH